MTLQVAIRSMLSNGPSVLVGSPQGRFQLAKARGKLMGMSVWQRLLVVSHADYGDEIRIIGARVATRRERRKYEEDV